jgi:protein-S-isoprenylcysteine O-methyltransferase Ste14
MVNLLKVLTAVIILQLIISYFMLHKKMKWLLIFRTTKTPSNESKTLEIIAALLVIGIAIGGYIFVRPNATALMWIGVLVFFLGGLLQIIARKQLHEDKTYGERLSTGFAAAQTGMYAKLRYPSKAALMLMIIGLCLLTGSWWALLIFIILYFPSVLYRISQEEKELLDKFGDRWLEYRKETDRFIPKVL